MSNFLRELTELQDSMEQASLEARNKAKEILTKSHNDLLAEIANQKTILEDWQNREAAVCPEDVGFEEFIKVKDKEIDRLKKLHKDAIEDLDDIRRNYPIDKAPAASGAIINSKSQIINEKSDQGSEPARESVGPADSDKG